MKRNLLKSALLALMVLVGGSAWAAGYTRTLSETLEVTGYKTKAFYNFQNNTPEVLPTSGDLRYRDGNIWGLHNFGSGTRSATVAIPVVKDEILIIQNYADNTTSINLGTEDSNLSSSTGYQVFTIAETSDNIMFTVPRYGGIVAALVMEKDATAQTANYTINYLLNGEGEPVKTVNGEGVVGSSINTLGSFFNDENTVKYYRADGQPESVAIAEEGNTFNINVRLASTYNYALVSSLGGNIATGSGFEGESVTVAYPRYAVAETKFYEADVTNKEYRKTIALNADNASATVEYAEKSDVNVVFFAEGENVEGMTVSTANNIPVRASNAQAGVATEDVTITSLPAGIYKLHVGIFTSKNAYEGQIVNFGIGSETFAAVFTGVNLNEVASDEITVTEESDVKFIAEGSWADAQFDYIWIEKTGDVETPGIELPEIVNADFNPEADPIGWTEVVSEQYKDLGMYQIGGEAMVRFAAPTADETHLSSEFAAGFECRWQTNFASYTQNVTMPAGAYALCFDVENVNGSTTKASYENRFFVKIGEETVYDNNKEWMDGKSAWTAHTIKFILTEEATVTISLGYGTGSNNIGANNTPAIYVSHLQLTTFDPLADAKAILKSEIETAEALKATEGYNAGIEELTNAIAIANNALTTANTIEELTNATETLKAAEQAFIKTNLIAANAALVEGAALDNPVVAPFIVNGTFDQNVNGWTCTGGFQNKALASNQQGDFTVPFFENWNPDAKENKMYQTVQNIPNGVYKLKIAAFVNILADPNESQFVFANNDKVFLTTGDPTFYEVYTKVEDNTLEVGLEQTTATANWMGIDNVSLIYFGNECTVDEAIVAAPRNDYLVVLAEANGALADEAYNNVTGEERTALSTAIETIPEATKEGYEAATATLTNTIAAFKNAKASYDALADANAQTNIILPYALASKKPEAKVATTAAAAETAANEVYSALRPYYESNAKAENVEGAEDKTALITNPDATDGNNGWTIEGNMNNPRNTESWTDSEGNNSYMYFDGGNWGGNSWTTTMKQTVTLPIGKYLLTAKGRASENVTTTLSVGEVSTEMAHVGSTGNIFARGWADSFIEFETPNATENEQVEIVVTASANAVHEWFSVGDFRLTKLKSIPTGIETVKAETAQKGIYNLNGQKVMKAQKGLYILNGKKVVVK